MEQGERDDSVKQGAYIFRMFDRWMQEALDSNVIIIGWSDAEGLIGNEDNWEVFRNIVKQSHYSRDSDFRRAGQAAGHLRRFIKMQEGDLVVVPHGGEFYLAKVAGPARYEQSKASEDTAYRRDVEWLNGKKPILRERAESALASRMRTQGTTAGASDLIPPIIACLEGAESWRSDLRSKLIATVLEEMRRGRIKRYEFGDIVCNVLKWLGADSTGIDFTLRPNEQRADRVATFKVAAGVLPSLTVAVQVEHDKAEPRVGEESIKRLILGIEARSAGLGMLVTSGAISEEAEKSADEYYKESGIQIVLVDGELLAGIIVDHGLNIIPE